MHKKLAINHYCLNCEFHFRLDPLHSNYCPNCGQECHNPTKPILHYIQDLIECLFHFDGKTLHTMRTVFLYPGKVTKEHINNIRARYTSPNKLFIFSLAVFIIFFEAAQDTMVKKDVRGMDHLPLSEQLTRLNDAEKIPFSNPFFTGEKVYYTVAQLKELSSLSPSEIKSWLERSGLPSGLLHRLEARMIRHCSISQQSLQDFNRHIVHVHYEVIFLMMPVSAFLIFIGFYRKGKKLYDSLVMSIHLYVFGLLIGIAVSVAVLMFIRMGLLRDTTIVLPLVMFISMTFNFIPAYKKVFERSWLSTIVRGLGIGMVNMSVQILVFWLIAGYFG